MKFDFKAWSDAHQKFFTDAKTLTDDDLAQLATSDPELAEKARAKRSGFVPSETDAERQRLAKTVTQRSLEMMLEDALIPSLMASIRDMRDKHNEKLRDLGKQIEDLRSEINYLTWTREETTKR